MVSEICNHRGNVTIAEIPINYGYFEQKWGKYKQKWVIMFQKWVITGQKCVIMGQKWVNMGKSSKIREKLD